MSSRDILIIGDSHVGVFSDLPSLHRYEADPVIDVSGRYHIAYLGPATAAGLAYPQSTYRVLTEQVLETSPNLGLPVLLVVGEIDCRAHLARHPEQSTLIEAAAYAYSRYVMTLIERGIDVYALSPVPSSLVDQYGPDPTVATQAVRNAVTRHWIAAVRSHLGDRLINIYPYFVDQDDKTRLEWFFDGIHLHVRARAVIEGELKKRGI